jgi:ABC-type lipoprotein release transport system permease subunit
MDGVWIALAALAISFLATLYPSLAAARLNPVEILRYE